jgi:carbon-monoxide dehydrogenase medium subunit
VAPSFGYAQPRHLWQAFDILDEYGRDASLLAGGTDLVVGLRKRRVAPRVIVDLKRISDLAPGIEETEGRVSITAPTRFSDIIADRRIHHHFPALIEAARTVGSVQIRNRSRSPRRQRCSTRCAGNWTSRAPKSAARRESAARARYCWTAGR